MGKKYIIEFEDKPFGNGLYKAKGFNSLVFDQNGLDRLTPFEEEIKVGDIVREGPLIFTVFYVGLNSLDGASYGIEGFDADMRWHTSNSNKVNKIGHNLDVATFMRRRGAK